MPYKQKDIDGCTEEFQVNASSFGGSRDSEVDKIEDRGILCT